MRTMLMKFMVSVKMKEMARPMTVAETTRPIIRVIRPMFAIGDLYYKVG